MEQATRRLATFPRHELLEAPLVTARASEVGLLEALGPPGSTADPLVADPCFYWDLRLSCGLVMAVTFHQLSQVIDVQLSADEVGHALRHLGARLDEISLLSDADPGRYAEIVVEPVVRDWELWRLDPEQRWERIESDVSELEARCLARSLNTQVGSTRYRARSAAEGRPTP